MHAKALRYALVANRPLIEPKVPTDYVYIFASACLRLIALLTNGILTFIASSANPSCVPAICPDSSAGDHPVRWCSLHVGLQGRLGLV